MWSLTCTRQLQKIYFSREVTKKIGKCGTSEHGKANLNFWKLHWVRVVTCVPRPFKISYNVILNTATSPVIKGCAQLCNHIITVVYIYCPFQKTVFFNWVVQVKYPIYGGTSFEIFYFGLFFPLKQKPSIWTWVWRLFTSTLCTIRASNNRFLHQWRLQKDCKQVSNIFYIPSWVTSCLEEEKPCWTMLYYTVYFTAGSHVTPKHKVQRNKSN